MKISKQEAEHYMWGGVCDGWHLVKTQGLSVIQERMPAGAAEIRHYHEVSRQFFYVLQGRLTLEVEGEVAVLGVQEGLEVAPHRPHQARNDSLEDVEFLVISQPTTRGDRIDLNE
ncbi:cupin domain-containing protein [Tumebacillus flagellatus]|uniref:Cupin n=1 Tax=Tumebacillus flagellatus TaxID=1157490 RepID=A0A074MHT4_9BACL|nr:cupin domain-containing protein [Tumebacillus flagellatus]KEO85247.1 cupin [Tumebacillus flagellatus]